MPFEFKLITFVVSLVVVCVLGLAGDWAVRAYRDATERRAIARRERALQNYFAPHERVPR